MALTQNQKTWTTVGVGVVLVGGGMWTAIYFINKAKKRKAGEGDSGAPISPAEAVPPSSLPTTSVVSPCISMPSSFKCKKEKCNALLASAESGGLTKNREIEICKQFLGLAFDKCIINPQIPGCPGTSEGRPGFSGMSFA